MNLFQQNCCDMRDIQGRTQFYNSWATWYSESVSQGSTKMVEYQPETISSGDCQGDFAVIIFNNLLISF